jgi:BMFP domain-containing protein YqiC
MSGSTPKRCFSGEELQKSTSHRTLKEQKAKRRKQLDLERKEEFEVMKSELLTLRSELGSARQRIAELEQELLSQDFERQITKNTSIIVKSLPPNSPFRRLILFFLSQSVAKKTLMNYYKISTNQLIIK